MFTKLLAFNSTTISLLALLLVVAVGGFFFMRKVKEVQFTTRMLVYGSVCIALSFVLSYIRLYRLPQGGSVTPASMLPMFMFAVMFGPIPGIIAGVAYGFLQYIQDGYVVHWAQFLLDYPLAFGVMGLAGLYRKNLLMGSLVGGFGRFFMHYLSGFIFFGMYAPEGTPAAVYSLIYNGSTIGVDTLICLGVALIPQIQSTVSRVQKLITV